MNAIAITNVCRLCPSAGGDELLHVFDERLSLKCNMMKEVIFVTTGVEILEDDLVSKKICQKCCNITLKMFQFRQCALKQDRDLKEVSSQLLHDKGIKLQNNYVTIKKRDSCPSTSKQDLKKKLHPTVADIYNNYPGLKLPKKCFEGHFAPVVSLTMGDVECYFKDRNLDMTKFIYKPRARRQSFNKVAKKKTSYPTKQKTVAPLKISKKLCENSEKPDTTNSNYVCTPLSKKRREKKRKIPSTDDDNTLQSLNKYDELLSQSATQPAIKKANIIESRLPTENSPGGSRIGKPILPVTPSQINPNSEDRRESSYNISETTSISSTNKPEFIESLGLIPRIVPTRSQKLLVCNVCGSVHNNSVELKCHNKKHMVCQFCKQKFKSLDAKENHVDNFCKIKNFMNSTGPSVALEQIHLNLGVRKKYIEAFSTFDSIPGLMEPPPLEHVLLEAAPYIATDDLVVLSDEEESSACPSDPLSGIPSPSADMPFPVVEKKIHKAVAKIRPDIKIKNNTIYNQLSTNLSDKEFIKNMIALVGSKKSTTCEQMVQTNLPDDTDIKMNSSLGICELKNLKEQLMFYTIPFELNNAPSKIVYQIKKDSKENKSMALWDDLPIIDVYKKSTTKARNTSKRKKSVSRQSESKALPGSSIPLILPKPPPDVLKSQVQSTTAVSSFPPVPTTTVIPAILPSPSRPVQTTSTSFPTSNVVPTEKASSNPLVVSNSVTQTTEVANSVSTLTCTTPPLKKGIFKKTSPLVINKYMPGPWTYVNFMVNKNAGSLKTYSMVNNSDNGSPDPANADVVSNNCLHANISNVNRPLSSSVVGRSDPYVSVIQQLPSTTTSLDSRSSSTLNTTIGVPMPNNNIPTSTPPTSDHVKFRVRNVWELQ